MIGAFISRQSQDIRTFHVNSLFHGNARRVVGSADAGVSLSVASDNCAETDEPTEMPFGMWTRMGPRHRCKKRSNKKFKKR